DRAFPARSAGVQESHSALRDRGEDRGGHATDLSARREVPDPSVVRGDLHYVEGDWRRTRRTFLGHGRPEDVSPRRNAAKDGAIVGSGLCFVPVSTTGGPDPIISMVNSLHRRATFAA